ncbi:FAD-dependent oxidoreductase [Gryllotalpicola kribbensis]|jgi:D-amino-acid dehydrogenase|uniref:FAD-dependent oxidoreductase n=1 Tax=Gryllotalpicola kribbensis TaxID=993084 RepID=A0ABP8APE6_9MICO
MSTSRVVVLGAGIAGAATAFGLARRGVSVVVVDAGLEGRATDAGAGIIQPWSVSRGGAFYQLYADGAAFYPSFVSALTGHGAPDIGYRRVGSLILSADEAELDAVEERLAARAADAPAMGAVQRLRQGEALARFPLLDPTHSAVWIEGGGRVDGRLLRAGLLAAVRKLDGMVVTDAATLEPTDDGFRVVVGVGEALVADAVVVACGAWSSSVLAPLGVSVPVEPQKGQILHLRVDADTSSWPVVHRVSSSHYLLAFDGGRIVAGATREFGSGFDTRVTAFGVQELLRNALVAAPGLSDAEIIETRVGLRPLPLSNSQEPVVRRLDVGGSVPLWVNAGFGAAGLTMGPLVGDRLAAEIVSAL